MLVNTLIEDYFMRKRNNIKKILLKLKKTNRIHECLQIKKDGYYFFYYHVRTSMIET